MRHVHLLRRRGRARAKAPELNPVEGVWAVMKSGLVNLVEREIDQLRDIVEHRLRTMRYRPEPLAGLLAKTGLDPRPP
jgi:transposase